MADNGNVTTARPGVREHYLRYREIQRELNCRLMTMLPKTALKECARKLDYLDNPLSDFAGDDFSALIDFAIYDYRIRGGTNAVERLAKRANWSHDSDEQVVLGAMLSARFTLLRVHETVPEVGALVSDLVYENEFLLADIGLSNTAVEDAHIAARVLEFSDFQMTTGAALPFDPELAEAFIVGLRAAFPEGVAKVAASFKPGELSKMAAYLIGIALADPEDVKKALPEAWLCRRE